MGRAKRGTVVNKGGQDLRKASAAQSRMKANSEREPETNPSSEAQRQPVWPPELSGGGYALLVRMPSTEDADLNARETPGYTIALVSQPGLTGEWKEVATVYVPDEATILPPDMDAGMTIDAIRSVLASAVSEKRGVPRYIDTALEPRRR